MLSGVKDIVLDQYLAGLGNMSEWKESDFCTVMATHPGLKAIKLCALHYSFADSWLDDGILKHANTLEAITDLIVPYNATLSNFGQLTRLRQLSLSRIREPQFAAVAQQLTSDTLRKLMIGDSCQLEKADFFLLCRNHPGLPHISLCQCDAIDDEAIQTLGIFLLLLTTMILFII